MWPGGSRTATNATGCGYRPISSCGLCDNEIYVGQYFACILHSTPAPSKKYGGICELSHVFLMYHTFVDSTPVGNTHDRRHLGCQSDDGVATLPAVGLEESVVGALFRACGVCRLPTLRMGSE